MRKDEFSIVEENCRDKIIKELAKIKEEIEDIEEPDHDFEGFYYCFEEALKIINKHIIEMSGEKNNDIKRKHQSYSGV